jgi:hypothetical protein
LLKPAESGADSTDAAGKTSAPRRNRKLDHDFNTEALW